MPVYMGIDLCGSAARIEKRHTTKCSLFIVRVHVSVSSRY